MNWEVFLSQFIAFSLGLFSYFVISLFIQPLIIKRITSRYLKKEFQQNIYLFENLIKACEQIQNIISNDLPGYPEWLSVGKFLTVVTYQSFSSGVIYDKFVKQKDLSKLQHILYRYILANENFFNQPITDYMRSTPEGKSTKRTEVLNIVALNKKWFEEDFEIYKELLEKL